jgi:hypothetical protein
VKIRWIESLIGVPIKEILAAREEASKSDSSDSDVQEVFDETAARSAKKKVPESNDPFDSSPSGDEDIPVSKLSLLPSRTVIP